MFKNWRTYAPICVLEQSSYPFLFLIFRAPDSAPIKAKMMYTSTKDSIKKKLVGIQVEFIYQHKMYRACRYADDMKFALQHRDEIKRILTVIGPAGFE